MAQELQTKANTVIHHLQFQDRTSQMLAEAVQQATAVIAVAGLQERQYDDQVIVQVGVLGRQLGTEVEVKDPGSIEMF